MNKLPDPGPDHFLILEKDFTHYQPKLATDEYWDEGYQKWIAVRFAKDCRPLFWKEFNLPIYRRRLP